MELLTAQQEVLLESDYQHDIDGKAESENITAKPDEGCPRNDYNPEVQAGMIQDSSSTPDITEATFESTPGDNINFEDSSIQNVESASTDIGEVYIASGEEDLQAKPHLTDISVPSDLNPNLPEIPEPSPKGGPAVSMTEPTIEPEESPVSDFDKPSVSDFESIHTDLNPNQQKDVFDCNELLEDSATPELSTISDSNNEAEDTTEIETYFPTKGNTDLNEIVKNPREVVSSLLEEGYNLNENLTSEMIPIFILGDPSANEPDVNSVIDMNSSFCESLMPKNSISAAGIPAPSLVSAALQAPPGKVLIPAFVDQVQGQALSALQILKVIEADVRPSDLCTRREYARWLLSASSVLSRNPVSKVYPAMYIENVTELAFDDISPEDPDFASIQGLAEAGLISSKLSRRDMLESVDVEQGPFYFFPESALSRQDLVSWKMAVDKRYLPEVDKKMMNQSCGYIDIDKINPDAWPALVADQCAGEQGIIALAFGYTRLFQPDKPVTKAQAAIALATGDSAEIVGEELTRIEAESLAESAVAAHTALVAQVEKDINASFEKELAMEREKIDAVEKMAQEAMLELETLRAKRDEENNILTRGRIAVESEMEVLSKLRREVEEQLECLMSNKTEISFEKERINKLRKEAELENQAIARLQYELDVERKALSMARSWAEDEAKRARDQAKSLEEARDRWEKQGIKVIVDNDLQEDANAGVTWVSAGKQSAVNETASRAEILLNKLKAMAGEIRGNSRVIIDKIILKITSLISSLKERVAEARRRTVELQDVAISKASHSIQELRQTAGGFSISFKESAKRIAEDCRDGVEKITQKFKI
ncbi:hypothetical protein GIB67_022805 [Kingdonia uniflora]|uniref:SLH domain-containing protein n=1 Tax=Kingdonia uniflora TaxID=39325 RepID=A0A7J7P7L0_9MAGN|nr:hypothetical protein GIB67_022805 [Kingdonia uniflora]